MTNKLMSDVKNYYIRWLEECFRSPSSVLFHWPLVQHIWHQLSNIRNAGRYTKLLWLSAHVSLMANERADWLKKSCSNSSYALVIYFTFFGTHYLLLGNTCGPKFLLLHAPRGQFNETYFFRLLKVSGNQILLKLWNNPPWGSFGCQLGFHYVQLAKINHFHNVWTRHHRKTNDPTFSYNFDMKNRLRGIFV